MAVMRSNKNIPALSEPSLGVQGSLCEKDMPNLDECLGTPCRQTVLRNG